MTKPRDTGIFAPARTYIIVLNAVGGVITFGIGLWLITSTIESGGYFLALSFIGALGGLILGVSVRQYAPDYSSDRIAWLAALSAGWWTGLPLVFICPLWLVAPFVIVPLLMPNKTFAKGVMAGWALQLLVLVTLVFCYPSLVTLQLLSPLLGLTNGIVLTSYMQQASFYRSED